MITAHARTRLSAMTWPELSHASTVLVPLGSTEQHGPHLPMSTDTLVAQAVANTAQRLAGVPHLVVAPPFPYGASGEHQDFPGTVSIGHEALSHCLIEMVRSLATWSQRIIFINGHGGNLPTLRRVVDQMTVEGHQVASVLCSDPEMTDHHAGVEETSLMLHIAPELVRINLSTPGNTSDLESLMPQLRTGQLRVVAPNGILGNPLAANPERGRVLLERMSRRVLEVLSRE